MTAAERKIYQDAQKVPHGTVKIDERPACDFCGAEAVVDGRTTYGSWAYMCPTHFYLFGVGLGLGRGQFLLVEKEQ
jgi:hypothetical protein